MFKNRKQGLQMASVFLAFTMLLSIPTFVSAQSSSKAAKKTVLAQSKTVKLPKIWVSGLESTYTFGQVPNFKAWSTGYNGTVQYKVLLIDQQSKKSLDLTKGYTKPYSYKTKLSYKLPKLSIGKYKAYVYVRRTGAKVSYDSYTIRNIVISNTISLNKNGQVFGSEKVSTINNDIVVTGDNVTLNNLKINGNLIINPGEKGTTNLNNISVKNVQVLSGGQNSIHFNGVKITEQLLVQTENVNNPVRIETTGNTEIANTQVKSDAILDSPKGSFGSVVIANNNQSTSNVELRGNFDKEITVQANACIKTASGAVVPTLVVAPENKDTKVVLDGSFGSVAINKETRVELTEKAEVKDQLKVNTQATISADSKAAVAKIEIAPENKDSKVTLSGNFKNVEVNKEAKLEVASGKIDNVVTNAKAEVSINKDAKVDKVDAKGNETKVDGEGSGSTVVDNKKDSTPLSNSTKLTIKANNTKVLKLDDSLVTVYPDSLVSDLTSSILVDNGTGSLRVFTDKSRAKLADNTDVITSSMVLQAVAQDGTTKDYLIDNLISFTVNGNKVQITPNKIPSQNLTIVIYEKASTTAKFIDQWNFNDGDSKFTTELDAGSYDAYVSGIDGVGKIHFEFQVK